jgi:hypothetical protein
MEDRGHSHRALPDCGSYADFACTKVSNRYTKDLAFMASCSSAQDCNTVIWFLNVVLIEAPGLKDLNKCRTQTSATRPARKMINPNFGLTKYA